MRNKGSTSAGAYKQYASGKAATRLALILLAGIGVYTAFHIRFEISVKDLAVKAEGVLVESVTNGVVHPPEKTNLAAWMYEVPR